MLMSFSEQWDKPQCFQQGIVETKCFSSLIKGQIPHFVRNDGCFDWF